MLRSAKLAESVRTSTPKILLLVIGIINKLIHIVGDIKMEYDVFICHASEDKDFVEPLAIALQEKGLKVWYDRFRLKLGDSLRQKIDDGLANCKFGVVVLSNVFFTKSWPQNELDALASRQNQDGKKVILPIWHNIEFNEIKEYSPLLSGLLAARSSDKLESVVEQIVTVCNEPIDSKKKSVFQTSGTPTLREECLYVIRQGDILTWRKLVNKIQSPIFDKLLDWKKDGEYAIQQNSEAWKKAVENAIEICLPGFIPLFSAIETGKKEYWNDATNILRRLAILKESMGGGTVRVLKIGLDLLYVAGNIGMAIAAETKQYDIIWNWMKFPMPNYRRGEELPWLEICNQIQRFESKDPFRFLLNLYKYEYINDFFLSEERMKEFLFKSNLLQSIIELSLITQDQKGIETIEKQVKSYYSNILVMPSWLLIKPDVFRVWSLDLFGSREDFVVFFNMKREKKVESELVWRWWYSWKKMCGDLIYRLTSGRAWVDSEFLILPGEPRGGNM